MIIIKEEDGIDQDTDAPLGEEACPDIAFGTGTMNVIGGNTKWGTESTEKGIPHILTGDAQIGIIEALVVLDGNLQNSKEILMMIWLVKNLILR